MRLYFYSIIFIILLFLSGCMQDPKNYEVYEDDFCTRYSSQFPTCVCLIEEGNLDIDGALYKTGRKINNLNDAEAFFNKWLFTEQTNYYDVNLVENYTRIECDSIGSGFYNCFVFNELYVTVSDDGDIYKTICGE